MTSAAARFTKTRARRRAARGFTLIELTVALLAGLLVAMAVVGLSKEATNTFHEEMRAATAEMSLRAAIDRLRGDLSRASFMGTPNIWGDPALVSNYDPTAYTLNIKRLAGIRVYEKGSMKKTNLGTPASAMNGTDDVGYTYSLNNGIAPDAIDISGNLNTADMFSVQTVDASSCGTGGKRLVLSLRNPPSYRLAFTPGVTGPLQALQRAFMPAGTAGFTARLQDSQGRVQYLPVCAVGYTAASPAQPYIDLASPPVIATGKGNVGGEAGFFSGSLVNPVLTVRYKIAPTVAPYDTELAPATPDPAKYDLYRVYIDGTGTEVGTPELVAEYAVDLKFSFTIDSTNASGPPQTPTRTLTTYPFGDAANGTYGASVSAVSTGSPPVGPQRIRSARVRLATRTALPDRSVLVSPPAFTPTDYLYRYCTAAVTMATCKSFARVRTVVTEVSLNNQSRAYYP